MEDATGQEVQHRLATADDNGVSGIGAALAADHDIGGLRELIDDFAFALIAPLEPEYDLVGESLLRHRHALLLHERIRLPDRQNLPRGIPPAG
jgi:hypothetical protein